MVVSRSLAPASEECLWWIYAALPLLAQQEMVYPSAFYSGMNATRPSCQRHHVRCFRDRFGATSNLYSLATQNRSRSVWPNERKRPPSGVNLPTSHGREHRGSEDSRDEADVPGKRMTVSVWSGDERGANHPSVTLRLSHGLNIAGSEDSRDGKPDFSAKQHDWSAFGWADDGTVRTSTLRFRRSRLMEHCRSGDFNGAAAGHRWHNKHNRQFFFADDRTVRTSSVNLPRSRRM